MLGRGFRRSSGGCRRPSLLKQNCFQSFACCASVFGLRTVNASAAAVLAENDVSNSLSFKGRRVILDARLRLP